MLHNKVEHFDLRLPSPLQFIPDLSAKFEVNLWVKRDDLIHPFVSGNKWRKLKYWMLNALETNISEILTFGGAYSNHLIATAAACGMNGLKSTGIVRGEEVTTNPVLNLCRLMGMELQFVSRESYKEKNMDFYLKPERLVIPEGGAGEKSLKGCEEMMMEPEMDADNYIVSAGTGTTAAGMANALFLMKKEAKVIAMACVKDLSLKKMEDSILGFNFDYSGKGFGKYGTQEINTAKDVFKSYGFLLDPVYTAKSWYGMNQLLLNGYFKKGSKIIFIHSGGYTGWFSEKEMLS